MQTHWRTKIAEEDLNDEQLLDRIDRLHQKITEMKNCQDGEMRLQATKSQVQYAPTLEKYFVALSSIAEEFVQLRIIDDLKNLPPDERKRTVQSWWYETNPTSLKYKKVCRIRFSQSSNDAQETIDRHRLQIAPGLPEIVRGLSAFNFGTGFECWPYSKGDGHDIEPIAVSDVDHDDGHSSSTGVGLETASTTPSQTKSGSPFVTLLTGIVYELIADGLKPTWDNVSRRIRVGQVGEAIDDKTRLLPTGFQTRITESRFAGNLHDFLLREDKKLRKKAGPQEDKNLPPDPILKHIDFKLRFQRHLSMALQKTGNAQKRPRREKSGSKE